MRAVIQAVGDWGFMTSSFREDPTSPFLENVLPTRLLGKGEKEGKVILLPGFETAPRGRKKCWIQQEKIKEGERKQGVHPAVPWAVAVVCAEVHKQRTGPRIHLFSHKCPAYWAGESHVLVLMGGCPQTRYCLSEVPGCELSCRAQVSCYVSTRGDGLQVEGVAWGYADTSGTWQDL